METKKCFILVEVVIKENNKGEQEIVLPSFEEGEELQLTF